MIGVTLASVLVAWVLGALIVAACRPREEPGRGDACLLLSLGALVGLGATSVTFFVASLFVSHPAVLAGVVEIGALGWLAWVVGRRPFVGTRPTFSAMTRIQWLFASVFAQCLLAAAVVAWRSFRAAPFGGWDAWAIWNLQARFLLRGGTEWPTLLAAPQLSWTHPDYPRLVSASIARIWAWSGAETTWAAGLISVMFAVALLGVLMASLHRLRGNLAASAGGLLLVGTPFFVTFSSNQHADIPFAGYVIAAVVCALRHDAARGGSGWLVLSGLMTGLAAWTKNEGLLFAVVLGGVVAVREWRRGSRRAARWFIGALLLALVPVAGFKLLLAPTNDLLAAPLGPRLAQLIDPVRHAAILAAFWRDVRQFGEWQVLPYFAMALALLAWRPRTPPVERARLVPLVLGVMLVGYYGTYLLSPHDLAWHLDSSLVRLLLQLWPLAILWWCLGLTPDLDGPDQKITPRRWPLAFVAGNGLVGVILLVVLSGQPAAGELVTRRVGFDRVSMSLGDGWFAPESHGRQRWAWSQGDATVLIYSAAGRPTAPLTLRFALRSLGARRVTVRLNDRVVWDGRVADPFVPVEVQGLVLPPGVTVLRIETDVPGRAESAQPGARSLAFALYDPELR